MNSFISDKIYGMKQTIERMSFNEYLYLFINFNTAYNYMYMSCMNMKHDNMPPAAMKYAYG